MQMQVVVKASPSITRKRDDVALVYDSAIASAE
jgi:hypothetical protein